MAKPSTRAKKKYNSATYRRYEFNLNKDSKLNAIIERYKSTPGANLSGLLKTLLCGHFGLGAGEADALYAEYHFTKSSGCIPNTELDKYFPLDPENSI